MSSFRSNIVTALVVGVLGVVASPQARAVEFATTGTISVLITYADFGGGDVTVRLSSQPASCPGGFWLAQSQLGFKSTLAFLLAARTAGENVLIGAETTAIWTGSGTTFCRIVYAGTPY
jgi:hypothetical protein